MEMHFIPHVERPGLKTVPEVREYLGKKDFSKSKYNLSHPYEILPLKNGSTNFAYRLTFPNPHPPKTSPSAESHHVSSAVLKYAAEYAVIDPHTPFTSERQVYEARAMQHLASALHPHLRKGNILVKLPELYFSDDQMHVIIMEDVTAPSESTPAGQEMPLFVSLNDLCRSASTSTEDLEAIGASGHQLGQFLALLHNIGDWHAKTALSSDAWALRELFAANKAGLELDVQTTFTEIPDKLNKFGVILDPSEKLHLDQIIRDMSSRIMQLPECIVMGDFWYGNIILKLSGGTGPKILGEISIIDWEFSSCGPAFADLAHFASETWLHDRFHPEPSPTSAANRRIVSALFQSYQAAGRQLDVPSIICYVGGHICCFLDYGNWTTDPELRAKVAREGVDMMLKGSVSDWAALEKDSFLAQIFSFP